MKNFDQSGIFDKKHIFVKNAYLIFLACICDLSVFEDLSVKVGSPYLTIRTPSIIRLNLIRQNLIDT